MFHFLAIKINLLQRFLILTHTRNQSENALEGTELLNLMELMKEIIQGEFPNRQDQECGWPYGSGRILPARHPVFH